MSWLITPQQKVAPTVWDPYFLNVSLLLHGNGANGSTTITDSSPTPKTVTAMGNAQISTAQSKFGGASIAFDGTGDYLTIPNNASLDLPGNFTVEAFIFCNTSADFAIAGKWGPPGQVGWTVIVKPSASQIVFGTGNSGAFSGNISFSVAVSTNAWHHVALARSASTLYCFFNGNLVNTATVTVNLTAPATFYAGTLLPGNTESNGYIDDLRITKGVARYTANFTPPTAPFPDI